MPQLKTTSIAGMLTLATLVGCSMPHQPGQSTSAAMPASTAMSPVPATSTITSLHTHHWTLHKAISAQGEDDGQWFLPTQASAPARRIALDFTNQQQVVVNNLCNRMGGAYQTEGSTLTIQRMVSTMMACSDPALMTLERKVGQWLPKAQSWRITQQDPARLEITFADGGRWQLQGLVKYETLYGQPQRVFLEVAPGETACNHPLMPHAQCLQVRSVTYGKDGLKEAVGAWEPFYDSIEGYAHQHGVRSILRLNRYTRTNIPADGSRYFYVLDMVVETEKVR